MQPARVGSAPAGHAPGAPSSAARPPSPLDRIERFLSSGSGAATVAVVLAALSALLRYEGLGPSSLWLDDAWPALVVRAESFSEVVRTGVTAPGFGFLLKGWFGVAGFSELNAQMLPFLAGILAPPAAYVAGVRLGASAWSALLAGSALVVSPVHVGVSVLVKQYTLEALGASLLLALGAAAIRSPRRVRVWVTLGVASIVLTLLSSILAVPAWAAFVSALVVLLVRRDVPAPALAAASSFAAFSAAYWWWFLRDAVNEHLAAYWETSYVSLAGPGEAVASVGDGLLRLAGGLLPFDAAVGAAILAGAAALAVWRRPVWALLLLSPTAIAVALAATSQAPLGGGRTDPYLYPSLAILLGVGVVEGIGLIRMRMVPLAVSASIVTLGLLAPDSPPYPQEDIRPLVRALERRIQPDDGLVVYEASNFAFGLYTSWPIDLVETDEVATGFRVAVPREGVYVLGPYRDDPERYAPAIAEASRHERIWLIASHVGPDLPEVVAFLREGGYGLSAELPRPGALLQRWERSDVRDLD